MGDDLEREGVEMTDEDSEMTVEDWASVAWEFAWRFVLSILFCWWLGLMFGLEGARRRLSEARGCGS